MLYLFCRTRARRGARLSGLGGLCFLLLLLNSACTVVPDASTSNKIPLTLWYWNRSISDVLLAQVSTAFPTIQFRAEKIGGNFDAKLRTALAGQASIPDIVGMNANIATYFPDADHFVDLYSLGARAVQHEYLNWKWQQGETPDGRLIGFPMDIGPTALFYRADIFQQAGLPTDPDVVSASLVTWDDYIRAAQTLQRATHGKSYMLSDIGTVFNQRLGQLGKRFFEPSGRYIGDQGAVKQAWDLAVKMHQLNLSARAVTFTTDWNAAASNGTLAAFVGAVWMKARLADAAPESAGQWRVASAPGGPGNDGGSFLAIPKASPHPQEAFAVIRWLESPEHQVQYYHATNLFPSTPGVYADPRMAQPEAFYGGQQTTSTFSQAAQRAQPGYFGPNYDVVYAIFQSELLRVDTQDADPQMAWDDAQQQVSRELSR